MELPRLKMNDNENESQKNAKIDQNHQTFTEKI